MRTFILPVLKKREITTSSQNEGTEHGTAIPIVDGRVEPETTIIAPDLEYAFKVENSADINAIRKMLVVYLKQNPHKISSASFSRDKWIVRDDTRYQREWLGDNVDGVDGILIHLNANNFPSKYNIPVIAVTALFLLFETANAYLDTLMTEVNLPNSTTSKTAETLAWMQTANYTLQDIIQYFAFQTPQYVDSFSRKIASVFRKKEYDIRDDFELSSSFQTIKTTLTEHPKKAIAITLLSFGMLGLTFFGMIMQGMVGYSMSMTFITKAHDKGMTDMDLHSLKMFTTIMFALDNAFNLLFQVEKFSLAVRAALWAYKAMSEVFDGCANRMSSCCANPFRFSYASDSSDVSPAINAFTPDERDRLIHRNAADSERRRTALEANASGIAVPFM